MSNQNITQAVVVSDQGSQKPNQTTERIALYNADGSPYGGGGKNEGGTGINLRVVDYGILWGFEETSAAHAVGRIGGFILNMETFKIYEHNSTDTPDLVWSRSDHQCDPILIYAKYTYSWEEFETNSNTRDGVLFIADAHSGSGFIMGLTTAEENI